MPLWRIEPVARPDDPRWQGRRIWREVIVRARNAAFARVIAAELERDPRYPPTGNESLSFTSGFDDEKLYWVSQLDDAEAAAYGGDSGPDGVVHVGAIEQAVQ